jgi:hypothetical protein
VSRAVGGAGRRVAGAADKAIKGVKALPGQARNAVKAAPGWMKANPAKSALGGGALVGGGAVAANNLLHGGASDSAGGVGDFLKQHAGDGVSVLGGYALGDQLWLGTLGKLGLGAGGGIAGHLVQNSDWFKNLMSGGQA